MKREYCRGGMNRTVLRYHTLLRKISNRRCVLALSLLLAAVFDFPFSGEVKVSASPFDVARMSTSGLSDALPPPVRHPPMSHSR
jgi:hypothetical protein